MKEKIVMFITYIEFFHKLHTKYLKRFSHRIQLMYSHINHDIHFDEVKKISSSKMTDTSSSKNSDEENESGTDLNYIQTDTSSTDSSDHENNLFESISRSRTNSSFSSTPRIKLSHAEHKKIAESDDNLIDIFYNIDMSCDSIINNETIKLDENIRESPEKTDETQQIIQASVVENNESIIIHLVEPSYT
jgi:hypothetical protein